MWRRHSCLPRRQSYRRQRSLAAVFALSLPVALAAGPPAPRLPRDNLLVYRGADGKAAPVKTVADWEKRRAEVVRGMESVMGRFPGKDRRGQLDMKVES